MDGKGQGSAEALVASALEAARRVASMKGKFIPPVIWPDHRLAARSTPVEPAMVESLKPEYPSPNCLRDLLDDMVMTMVLTNGNGISAPQVGVNLRAIALRVQKTEHAPECVQFNKEPPPEGFTTACTCNAQPKDEYIHLVNPEIIWRSEGFDISHEGCLSLPGLTFPCERAKVVRVRAFGYDGRPLELGGDGLLAVALQHEIDHLDGRMVVDGLSLLKRDLLKRRLTKLKEHGLRYRSPDEFKEARQ